MIKDWETIGIREQWLENGWTEEQMMNRIKELNLPPPPFCALQPYYLNYMQQPNMNEIILKIRDQARDIGAGDSAWIAASNLWTPGQTINIVFANSTHQEFIKAVLMKDLQPNISMKLAFPGGTSGNILVNVITMSGVGGNSAVGRTGSQQTVNLNSSSMSGANISALLDCGKGGFNWARYLVCHEFGHAMGLWHEWNREMCGRNGVTCSGAQDSYSTLNYPLSSSGGSADAKPSANTMDCYSPEDRKWLQSVYKGTGKVPDTTTTTTITQPKVTPKVQPKSQIKKTSLPKKQLDTIQISPIEKNVDNVYIYILLILGLIGMCITMLTL